MKKFLLLTIFILALLTVSGCGEEPANNPSASKDTLKVMFSSNIVSLDTSQAADLASLEVIADCIDGLMQLDSNGKAIPALAQDVKVEDDGKKFTFHLRDAKWSNGDDVTADDFVFAWRRHCQSANEYAYIFGSTVACVKNADAVIKGADPATLGVSAPDPKTLVVELDAPVPFFLSLMAFPTFYPINEKFYNGLESGSYGTSPETFLSNGAFVLTDYLPGAANIQLKKNNTYWDASRVSLENLQYQVVSSSDNALTSFRNGTLNVVNISGNQFEQVQKEAELLNKLNTFPSGCLYYLSFNQDPKNHHAGALANVNLRLAISNAIDRESLVNNFVTNGATPTYTPVPVNFAPSFETGQYFAEDQSMFADYVGFNVEKAQEFLAAAKSELGAESFSLNFIYANDGGDTSAKVVQAIKSQVESNLPGVTLNLQPMPKAEYLSYVTSNSYDVALVDWVPDYNDPMTFLTLWTTDGCEISEHWSNADYDKIIENCTTGELADKYEARWKSMQNAERILMENAVIAPLYTDANAVLISPNVMGIDFHVAGVARVYKNVKLK